ncbi:MAG: NAD-dependent epimerase/dehydratase family protein [Actinomycetales bacterium]|nr:MAG: NAD-dependent epimerase/dehydratase family protein [Actinomycetales bacterium]
MLVLGHTGFLGQTVFQKLRHTGFKPFGISLSEGFDLRNPGRLTEFLGKNSIGAVINCAAKIGGIEYGRQHPIALFEENLRLTLEILNACSLNNVVLLNPISNCTYPKDLSLFQEKDFWNGALDESVLVYGSVRKMAWVGALAYHQEKNLKSINLIFPNLYGPGDHLDPVKAHALGGLVSRIVTAHRDANPEVIIWGTGKPIREWMYVEDAAEALLLSLNKDLTINPINVGSGKGISIADLAILIVKEVGYKGVLKFDSSRQDGAPVKIMDGTKGRNLLGWHPKTSLDQGIKRTVADFTSRLSV